MPATPTLFLSTVCTYTSKRTHRRNDTAIANVKGGTCRAAVADVTGLLANIIRSVRMTYMYVSCFYVNVTSLMLKRVIVVVVESTKAVDNRAGPLVGAFDSRDFLAAIGSKSTQAVRCSLFYAP